MAKSEVHLLVLIHGMWGSPCHLDSAARVIQEVKGSKEQLVDAGAPDLHVLVAATNAEDHTYDGIDNGGERVAQEVYEEMDKLMAEGRAVTRFSVCGYSMGGLIARYLLGILHTRNFFEAVTPVNFTTFATPHVGVPRYPGLLPSIFFTVGPRMLSKTGEQFFHADSWSNTGRPLLTVMADPTQIFFKTLCSFPNIAIYANAIHDALSPYASSAIELEDPFLEYQHNGIEIKFDPDYPHFIDSWLLPDQPLPPPTTFSAGWFKATSRRPLLPPALQFRFPINLVIIVVIPLLIPVFGSFLLYRFSKASKLSRARIKTIEGSESYQQRLIHMFSDLENRMEEAMADVAHDVAEIGVNTPVSQGEQRSTTAANSRLKTNDDGSGNANARPPLTSQAREGSLLTQEQENMVRSLNTIPNMKKYRVFFEEVRNSHAIIISRDPRRFEIHERGVEVLRHWAERFGL